MSKSAEQLSLKLMGISPLHGSHPAVPFAIGATSSHGLRLYGSIIITIEGHGGSSAANCLWNAGRNRYLVSSLLWWVTACQPNGSLSIETYSAALCCVD
ncbi:hypothetical protein [Sporofaciens musculi]|uniref:hypothetical protein n=1 Tax=Sporofaciens musculi TaxID=2681861 RepID=UPI00194EB7FE|nr:hypothetical protein [Sporofaciens musculi]